MQKIDRLLEKLANAACNSLIAICVVLLVAWIFVFGVFISGRAIFNLNWTFVEEFTGYWVILLTFFSAAYVLRQGAHIKVDIVVTRLPKGVRRILAVVTDFLALVVVIYLTRGGVEWFWYGVTSSVCSQFGSAVPLWPMYLLIPIGLAVLGLGLLWQFYHKVIRLVQGKEIELK